MENKRQLMRRITFENTVFDTDFLIATFADGAVVRFTRQERALLSQLALNPGRLFTRDELFGTLGSKGSDRNVDFVINRLRSKLMDTKADRRFISTQYGEGYVWVAKADEIAKEAAFIVIGPSRGLNNDQTGEALNGLQAALQTRIGPGRKVDLVPSPDAAVTGHSFSIEVSFHPMAGLLNAAFVLREAPSGMAVASFRKDLSATVGSGAAMESLANAVLEATWKQLALGSAALTPADPPLHLRLLATELLFGSPGEMWTANEMEIARLRARDRSDPTAAMLWAMHLYARAISTPGAEPESRETVARLGGEIESLVIDSLPFIRDDTLLALAAAKLLLSVHRGHDELAETLATKALAESVAFAAAMPLLAEIKSSRGEFGEALQLFNHALALCEAGSWFEVYIQILKASTLIAMGDRSEVEATYDRLLKIAPMALQTFGFLFIPDGDVGLARKLAHRADKMDERQARRAVAYLHYRIARHFRKSEHAANILRGPLTHLVRRFGPGVASDAIWCEMPEELLYLRTVRSLPNADVSS